MIDSLLLEEPLHALPDGRPGREVWIAARTDGVKGSGTETDPYDGSTAARFDALMQSIPANTTVHLGPGTFETKGSGPGGWAPKSGQKLFGSGMEVTILRLVNATSGGYRAIHSDYPNLFTSFEAADLTVDCNLGGQTVEGYDFAPVACGAISMAGRHIRLRRIRAINFGTQTAAHECFVFYLAVYTPSGSDDQYDYEGPYDCVVEDCILEQPALNNVRETTGIMLAAGEDPNGVAAYHRGCVIRNCVVDCEYRDRPVAIESITIPDSDEDYRSTVTTRTPHGRDTGDWVVISGTLENGSANTVYNGSYQIIKEDDVSFTYAPYDGPGHSRPTVAPTGDIWLGKWSSHFVRIAPSGISKISGPGNRWTVRVTTETPHLRVPPHNGTPGNNVYMHAGANPGPYGGPFTIRNVLNPFQLEYTLDNEPSAPPSSGYLGPWFQALTGDGGSGAVIESNRILNCAVAVYHDAWSGRDLVVRNNHFHSVVIGIAENNMGIVWGQYVLDSLTYGLENGVYVATAETTFPEHGLVQGDGVYISGATGQAHNEYFNEYHTIDSVPDARTFKYALVGNPNPPSDSGSSPTGNFGRVWQVRHLVIENNVMEMAPTPTPFWKSVGARLLSPTVTTPAYAFPELVIRNNVLRIVDGEADPSAIAFRLQNCKNAFVEKNVVDLALATPLRHYNCQRIQYFNNTDSTGFLLRGAEETEQGAFIRSLGELTTAVGDSLLAAIM